MAGREWPGFVGMVTGIVGMVTGLAGALIAGGVAYFTIVRQVDDVRVVIGDPPQVYVTRKVLEASGEQELTFMNAGNRNAAVSSIKAMATKMEKGQTELPKCETEETFPIFFKTDSFGIKPGEVIVVKLGLYEGYWKKKDEGFVGDNTFFHFTDGDMFLACLSVSIATPDSFYRNKVIPAFKYTVREPGSVAWTAKTYEPLFEENRPISLLKLISR
jgi:hypothetical protein